MLERKYENVVAGILGLTFGIVFFDRNSLNFLMPILLKEIPLSNTQIGAAASGLALTWACSGFMVGWLSDRIGRRKPILLTAVIVFSLSSFMTGLTHSFLSLLGARLLMGLAEGPVLPIAQAMMAQVSSPQRRGRNMGLMQNVLSNLMGSLIAPLVVVGLADVFGWRAAFFFTGLPGLLAAILIWIFIQESVEPKSETNESTQSKVSSGCLASRNLFLCIPISALMVGWMIVGWIFLPLYFTKVAGFSTGQMSVMMSALGISGALAGFVVPALSDRFGRRPVMIAGCLAGILTPFAAIHGSSSVVILTLLAAAGWMAGGVFSIFMATIPSESAAATRVTTAMALVMGSGELFGGGATPVIVGWFADRHGLLAPLVAQIVLALCAAILSLGLIETAPMEASSERQGGHTGPNSKRT